MSRGPFILGVSSHYHDSAAALIEGETVIAAAQEERFTRIKGDRSFPHRAIGFCMSKLPHKAKLDGVAYFENPGVKAERIIQTARRVMPGGATLWPRMLRQLGEMERTLPAQLGALAEPEKVHLIPHHKSHAAAAFLASPFEKAAVLVADGVGEFSTTTLWSGEAGQLTPIAEMNFPHSLGLFYSAFTQYCGFKVNSGEYKLMGLAPFGRPTYRDLILDKLMDLRGDGSFALNLPFFQFDRGPSSISPLFEMLFGQPMRDPDAPITPHYMDVAASVQAVLEIVMYRLARTALQRTGHDRLCLAGGVALNCISNTKLLHRLQGLKQIWVQPAAGDAGAALGAALALTAEIEHGAKKQARRQGDAMKGSYLGPEFSAEEIETCLREKGVVFERCDDDATLCEVLADALAEGAIIGHFDGPMEFGPRALGNRSILADPRRADMHDRINRWIKFRESWRPLAPIVLKEQAAELFETPTASPYMLFVSKLKPEFRGEGRLGAARGQGLSAPIDLINAVGGDFPAVTHVDFTARLQTIGPGSRSRARAVLSAFHQRTGCPMLLNTSFNVRGEPIVCSPEDAVECFLNTGMDVLAIGPFVLRREAQPAALRDMVGGTSFDAD